ncbi:DegT/DnrJ/EryC1/StrS aminotransferase [Thiorhodococcus drewsii AZ1]|uniref:GDP-perosamine synthase n=1 Tax=Thiorhodococcus drewsii AZ1 TaxID=765913 RepID=G2E7E7_9GAMM|nr:LegC family aminotransferase [Thiorhodococcus drewsii]EGV27986.1 DegT/DnrJ/EryC1/StrS aminotransferase [Thiorhodococcus drewsii AZ1]
MNALPSAIIDALRAVLGPENATLHEPRFQGHEQRYVQDCIASTFVSSVGAYVDRFERELADYTGARRAVAVVNGTAALQIALQLAGVEAKDEVIVPALTFVATANAVHYLGAVPHFADSAKNTLGLDPTALRDWLGATAERSGDAWRNRHTGRRLRALVPMHTFGHPCDLNALLSVAHDYRLTLVEDAAESLGSRYHSRHTGTFGRLGTLSFNGNKIITTGGGGAILTDDKHLADHAKHLSTTAKVPHRWDYMHDEIGYNFRMPNINAALGCAQLEQLPKFLASKRRLAARYREAFAGLEQASLMQEPQGCESNYWLQTLILDEAAADQRDAILTATNDAGLMTRPAWTLMHQLPPYRDFPLAPLPMAESLARRLINLPSSAGLA